MSRNVLVSDVRSSIHPHCADHGVARWSLQALIGH
jgi:hypothetical protein